MGVYKIGLGTVQFGLDYGISNTTGKPGVEEVGRILKAALSANIGFIDTAPAYGNAEEIIGKALSGGHSFKIISKTPVLDSDTYNRMDGDEINRCVKLSLKNMKIPSLYGLLIHQSSCLFKVGGKYILESLINLKESGLVKKIGISIYDGEELDRVLELYTPDIVQLPMSPLDQRLIQSGHIKWLKKNKIEIHLRSIFLQGLLLLNPDHIPKNLSLLKNDIKKFHNFTLENEISPLEACLLFGLQNEDIDAVIVGANQPHEFMEIINAAYNIDGKKINFSAIASSQTNLLNPAYWAVNTYLKHVQ